MARRNLDGLDDGAGKAISVSLQVELQREGNENEKLTIR